VRWRHPRLGLVRPDRFIPLAEQTGLIDPLTNWVFATAAQQSAAWQRQGLSLDMAINLSAKISKTCPTNWLRYAVNLAQVLTR
jgi:EAL domain-containing protein (putative c-di-GMP-specific phosphodiesterase class I)